MLATQCDNPTSTGREELGTPSKLGQLIGEMKPVAIRMIPNFTPRHIISSPAVAAGKSEEGCIGDAGNPISPKDKEERGNCSITAKWIGARVSSSAASLCCFRCASFEAGDDCQSLVPRRPIHPWSHEGLTLFVYAAATVWQRERMSRAPLSLRWIKES